MPQTSCITRSPLKPMRGSLFKRKGGKYLPVWSQIEAPFWFEIRLPGGDGEWFPTRVARSPGGNHGTGCLLSSSIACGLAVGLTLNESIRRAKERLSDALARGLVLGHGNGPVDFR